MATPELRTLQAAYFGLLCASLIVQCPPTSAFRFSFPYRVAVGAGCRGVVLFCLASLGNPAKRARARGFFYVFKRFLRPEPFSCNVFLGAIVRIFRFYV